MTTPSGPFLPAIDLTACARPRTVDFAGTADALLIQGVGLIQAITWINAAVTLASSGRVRDGQDVTGYPIAYMAAPAGGGGQVAPGLPGIYFGDGLFIDMLAGNLEGTITYVPLLLQL